MKQKTRMIIPAVIFCMICIMLFSAGFRLLFHRYFLSLGDDFTDGETGLPYLAEMDCYYHLRMTRDIALYGHPGDTFKDGVPWDCLGHAPEGRDVSDYKPLLAYLAIGVNRLISVFVPRSLEQTAYWLNVFLSALLVIPVFLLTFEMCGLTGAIAASVLSVMNLGYLCNTVPGFYDTDCVISWTACFFFYFGVKSVKGWQEKNKKSLALNGIGLIVSFIVLYHSWNVYYLFPVIFVGALILFTLLTRKKGEEKSLYSFLPLLLAAGIIAVILILEKELFAIIKFYLDQFFATAESSSGVFQNVYSSISELQKPPLWAGSFSDLLLNAFSETNLSIISLSGGILPFLSSFAMCGILIRRIIRKDVRIEYLLLLLWFSVTLLLSFRGQRFIILFAVSAAILAGNLAGTVCVLTDQRKPVVRIVCSCLILVLMLFPALYGACGFYRYISAVSAEDALPDGPVEECLMKIRENTPEDTRLASWWDYGYFLEEKGGRRTLFNGGTQDPIRTFFVARAFATEDGELSANIFRMLSGSGNRGCEVMLASFGDTEETISLMDELLSGGKTEAREKLLRTDISADLANEITELLFPENLPLTECVITPDMPWYCGWFPYLGLTAEEKDEKPWHFYMEFIGMPVRLSESGRTAIDTENGYFVIIEQDDRGWHACTSLTEEPSDGQPLCVERLIVADHEGTREYAQGNALPVEEQNAETEREAGPWTVIVDDRGQETTLSLVSSAFADSVFGRLVCLGGEDLPRYEAEPEFSNEVLVYRITE